MQIHIDGVMEVQTFINLFHLKLHAVKSEVMMRFAGELASVAQEILLTFGYYDTGALYASIHPEMVRATIESIITDVVAGDPNVVRGEGRYAQSTKRPGTKVEPMPTTEYAVQVEEEGAMFRGPAKYMETAYQFGEAVAEKRIAALLQQQLR